MVNNAFNLDIDTALVAHVPSVVAHEKFNTPHAEWTIRRVVQRQRCMDCQDDTGSTLSFEAEISLPGGVVEYYVASQHAADGRPRCDRHRVLTGLPEFRWFRHWSPMDRALMCEIQAVWQDVIRRIEEAHLATMTTRLLG